MSSTALQNNYSQSQQQQASTNYKEAFALFDKRGNPTLAEISDLEKSVGGDCKSPKSRFL